MIFRVYTPFIAALAGFRAFCAKIAGYRALCTPEEQTERLNECEICEFLTEERQCAVCTCFVDAKTMLCAEKCPKNRWLAIWSKKVVVAGGK